ncbi:MAG: peroxidase family protein [Aliishimia sp.]
MSEDELIVRPIEGSGANSAMPEWGASGAELLRLAIDERGEDGSMSGEDRPGAREISNAVTTQSGETINSAGASDFLWIWGQFLDHDLSLTESGNTTNANIQVPVGDSMFDPFGTGEVVIPFSRVDTDENGAYHNDITAYIDASMIYGSDVETLTQMRIEGGKLVMTEDAQLMLEGVNLTTGDVRAAENIALSSMHTIFTREHNRLVDELVVEDPTLSDDQLFEAARARVEGIVQAITFNDFLPILLGEGAFDNYAGYDETVNAGISIEFSTAVYRLGHTLLSPNLLKVAEGGEETGQLALRDAFFRPSLLREPDMISDILRGAATQTSQAVDTQVVEDVRSFLFGPPGAGGFDLAALNIQRGRDLGVASYNNLREAIGLDRVQSFADITSDIAFAAQLEAVYGDVDLIDAWIGGLAEDAVDGGLVGETFSIVMIDQFTRLRDGDAFWSEGRAGLSEDAQAAIWDTTLADIILRNTDVEAIQSDVFAALNRVGGTDAGDYLFATHSDDFIWGGKGNDELYGRKGDDELQGGKGNDILQGNKGDDILLGQSGNDDLRGGVGMDQLNGGAGRDMLLGNKGDDLIEGDTGNDVLKGQAGDDVLDGGAGNDRLFGGLGNDTLTGGTGRDVFEFYAGQSGSDTIQDFDIAFDEIKILDLARKDVVVSTIGSDLQVSSDAGWTLLIEDHAFWALDLADILS